MSHVQCALSLLLVLSLLPLLITDVQNSPEDVEKALLAFSRSIGQLTAHPRGSARETRARVATLWLSIEKQLQAQMAFPKNLKGGRCQSGHAISTITLQDGDGLVAYCARVG